MVYVGLSACFVWCVHCSRRVASLCAEVEMSDKSAHPVGVICGNRVLQLLDENNKSSSVPYRYTT